MLELVRLSGGRQNLVEIWSGHYPGRVIRTFSLALYCMAQLGRTLCMGKVTALGFFSAFHVPRATCLTFWIDCYYIFGFFKTFYRAHNTFLSKHCPGRENIGAETLTCVTKSHLLFDKTICTASVHTKHKSGGALFSQYQHANSVRIALRS